MSNQLPKGWKMVRLGEVCKLNPRKAMLDSATEVTFLPMGSVSEGGEIVNPQIKTYSEVQKGYTAFAENDVLFAKITPCMENGKGAIARHLVNGYGFGSTEFHVLRASDRILPELIYRYLGQVSVRKHAEQNMVGSAGQKRVPQDFLENLKIPLPPLEIQYKIVSILGEADGLRKLRKQADGKMRELIPALFDDMFGDPFGNEKKWPVKSLDDIALDVQYGTSAKANESGDGIPVLRMNNLNYDGSWDLTSLKHTELSDEEYDKYTVQYGDMLINRTNSRELVGKTAVWDKDYRYAFAGYLVRFRLNPKTANPFYVSCALNLPSGKKLLFNMAKPAVNMSNISASDMKRIRLAMPPVELQDEFSEKARDVVARLEICCEARKRLDDLFNSLMDRCMSGEIR